MKPIYPRLTYNCAHLRSTKEKKEENIWRRKIFFAEGTINGGGKGGSYPKMENMFFTEEKKNREVLILGQ